MYRSIADASSENGRDRAEHQQNNEVGDEKRCCGDQQRSPTDSRVEPGGYWRGLANLAFVGDTECQWPARHPNRIVLDRQDYPPVGSCATSAPTCALVRTLSLSITLSV